MSVAFTSGTGSETVRASYQRVVTQSLDLMRPAGEHWSVTMAETTTTLRLDFARDTDAPRSLTIATDGDDDQHSQLFRSVWVLVGVLADCQTKVLADNLASFLHRVPCDHGLPHAAEAGRSATAGDRQ